MAGSTGVGGAGVTTGGAGAGGSAGVTTGGAGAGGSAGGAAGAAGTPADMPDCPLAAATGNPCATVGSVCRTTACIACSDQYWRRVPQGVPCVCNPTGVWMCAPGSFGGPIGDCFFDPPLDCAIAQLLYEDAACQMHPPCSP